MCSCARIPGVRSRAHSQMRTRKNTFAHSHVFTRAHASKHGRAPMPPRHHTAHAPQHGPRSMPLQQQRQLLTQLLQQPPPPEAMEDTACGGAPSAAARLQDDFEEHEPTGASVDGPCVAPFPVLLLCGRRAATGRAAQRAGAPRPDVTARSMARCEVDVNLTSAAARLVGQQAVHFQLQRIQWQPPTLQRRCATRGAASLRPRHIRHGCSRHAATGSRRRPQPRLTSASAAPTGRNTAGPQRCPIAPCYAALTTWGVHSALDHHTARRVSRTSEAKKRPRPCCTAVRARADIPWHRRHT